MTVTEVLNNSKLSERLVAELMGKANDDRESLTWTLHMSREFLDEIDLDELQNLLENSDTAGTLGATKSVQLTRFRP